MNGVDAYRPLFGNSTHVSVDLTASQIGALLLATHALVAAHPATFTTDVLEPLGAFSTDVVAGQIALVDALERAGIVEGCRAAVAPAVAAMDQVKSALREAGLLP